MASTRHLGKDDVSDRRRRGIPGEETTQMMEWEEEPGVVGEDVSQVHGVGGGGAGGERKGEGQGRGW